MIRARKIGRRWYGTYTDLDGRERGAGGADSEQEALNLAKDQEWKLRHGVWTDPADGRMPLRAYAEQMWWPAARHNLSLNTQTDYMYKLGKYVWPVLGDVAIGRIHHSTLQSFLTDLLDEGKSVINVRCIWRVLRVVMRAAVVDRVIPTDPTTAIKLPKVRKVTMNILDEEIDKFEAAVEKLDMRWQLFILLSMELGTRFSETRAIRGRHLNQLRSQVTIRESLNEEKKEALDEFFRTQHDGYERIGRRWYLKYPKSGIDAPERVITIDRAVMNLLVTYLQQENLGPDDLIFVTDGRGDERGTKMPIGASNFRITIWKPLLEEAQLSHALRIHDLRHTAASIALRWGATLIEVRDMMGHRDVKTTQLYCHATSDAADNVAAARKRAREARRKAS